MQKAAYLPTVYAVSRLAQSTFHAFLSKKGCQRYVVSRKAWPSVTQGTLEIFAADAAVAPHGAGYHVNIGVGKHLTNFGKHVGIRNLRCNKGIDGKFCELC